MSPPTHIAAWRPGTLLLAYRAMDAELGQYLLLRMSGEQADYQQAEVCSFLRRACNSTTATPRLKKGGGPWLMKDATELRSGPEQASHRQALAIVAVNNAGIVTKANVAARKILNVEASGVESADLGSLIAGVLKSGHGAARATISMAGEAQDRQDILVVLSEGSGSEPVVAAPETATAEPVLAETERGEGAVADFIAHELRNPLSAILGISQVLEDRAASVSLEERREALQTIHSEADKALMILQGLLRLAEARTRDAVELTSVPLHSVVRKVIASHSRRNPHRFLTLSGDSPLFAMANSMWVELAISNLLSNAEKYTPRDRRIEVVFHEVGSWATILILDDGAGLRPELYKTLWEIYSRGPESGVNVGGSGIGLALCKELIESMGGHVWAGPGKAGGSVFALSLPSTSDMTVPAPLMTPLSRTDWDDARESVPVTVWT
jgi:signal transduction histidine kinase